MIKPGDACPTCHDALKYYDSVLRMVRTKNRTPYHIKMRRFRCVTCCHIHREITEGIIPFKRYEADLIHGVLEGHITSDTLGYEDFPHAKTMQRWIGLAEKQIL